MPPVVIEMHFFPFSCFTRLGSLPSGEKVRKLMCQCSAGLSQQNTRERESVCVCVWNKIQHKTPTIESNIHATAQRPRREFPHKSNLLAFGMVVQIETEFSRRVLALQDPKLLW
jgi:hypothetical protein